MSINEQKINDSDETHFVVDDSKHRLIKLSLQNFVLNLYFRIEANINLMRLSSQHDFLQSFMTIYKRNYELQMLNFDERRLK